MLDSRHEHGEPQPRRQAYPNGAGLYTLRPISAGGRVAIEYAGTVITTAEADRSRGKYQFPLGDRRVIGGKGRSNRARFVNHSCRPNAAGYTYGRRIRVCALRSIGAGVRHAYVRTKRRNKGVGTLLLQELIKGSKKPILIGTWKAADWAIRFYQKHGFCLVDEEDKNRLLKRYWAIPDRHAETSVVLVDEKHKKY